MTVGIHDSWLECAVVVVGTLVKVVHVIWYILLYALKGKWGYQMTCSIQEKYAATTHILMLEYFAIIYDNGEQWAFVSDLVFMKEWGW